jgi:transposase
LRVLLRVALERDPHHTAAILGGRTLQSTPGSDARAGYDAHKKKRGSRIRVAVDTLGKLRALRVTLADEQERSQVADLAAKVQAATGDRVEIAFVDQGSSGEEAARQAQAHGIQLEAVKHVEAKQGFILLPRRWVVERSFGWLGRFRRLARDSERLAESLAGWHWFAFIGLLLAKSATSSA